MKKLLLITAMLTSFLLGRAQLPIGCPTCTTEVKGVLKVDSLFLLPLRNDTLVNPGRAGAIVTAYGKSWLYTGTQWALLTGIAWGNIPGNIASQTDLMALLNAKQNQITNGYGWKLNGAVGQVDTAVLRKVDTVIKLDDSTLAFRINGGPLTPILIRGSAGGTIVNAISITAPSALFTSPVTFTNSVGSWTGTLSLINQSANTFFSGPSTGSPAIPSFRQITLADIPTGIPNGNLLTPFIYFDIDNTGSAPTWDATSAGLNGHALLHLPYVGTGSDGIARKTSYVYWNGKVDSTVMSNDSVYEWRNGLRYFRYYVAGGGGAPFDSASAQGGGFHTLSFNDARYLKRGDSTGNNGFATPALAQKKADSLAAIFNASLLLKKDKSDSAATNSSGFVTQASRQKLADSLLAVSAANLLLKKDKSDSAATNPAAFTTQSSRQKLADSLLALISNKMSNFGGAPGWLVGSNAGIPSPTSYNTGTHYTASDSGFIYIDTGSGGTRGWKKISSGNTGGTGSGGVANFLNVQVLGYGAHSARPTSGTGLYWDTDSSSLFYVNGASYTNLLPYTDVTVLGKGSSGDSTLITASGGKLYVARIRDSSSSCAHLLFNADGSVTLYTTCSISTGPWSRTGGQISTTTAGDTTNLNRTVISGTVSQDVTNSSSTNFTAHNLTVRSGFNATTVNGFRVAPVISNTVTSLNAIVVDATGTPTAAVTGFNGFNISLGSSTNWGTKRGISVTGSGGTNERGFETNIAAGTGNYPIYASGTAPAFFQGAIGINQTAPNASALLDIVSTSAGVLIPRMTTAQMNAITSPAGFLMVNNTDSGNAHVSPLMWYDGVAGAWKKMDQGAGTTGGGTPAGVNGSVQINKGGAFGIVPKFTADTITNVVSARSIQAYDTLRAKELADTGVYLGYSITLGLTGPVPYRYATQTAGQMGVFELNRAISGTRLVKLAAGDSSLEERWNWAIPTYTPRYRYLVFEYVVNDAGSGGNAPTDSARYKAVWDSLFTNILPPLGWPMNKVIVIGGSIVGSARGTGGNLSPGAANVIAYKNIALSKAAFYGAKSVDMYSYMLNNGGYALLSGDSLHPTQYGHNVMDKGFLTIADSLSFIQSNSLVAEKRLTVRGDADIVRANVSGQTSTNNLAVSGSVLTDLKINGGTQITGNAVPTRDYWRLYGNYSGGALYTAGLGFNSSTVRVGFFVPQTAWNGWEWLTRNTGDSSWNSPIATLSKTGYFHASDSIAAEGNINTRGKFTGADYQLDAGSSLSGLGDKLLLWHNGNTKFGIEMQQVGTPYFTRIFAPSSSGYGVAIGNKSASDGTTFKNYQWWTTAGIFTTFDMLPNQAGADSVVTTTTSGGVVTYGRKSLASFSGASLPFADNTALLKNNTDNTKQFRFDLSGLTTGTTRVGTVPNFSTFTFAAKDQGQTWSGTQDMTGATVTVATQSAGDNSTKTASTAFVIANSTSGNYTPTLTNTTNISSSSITSGEPQLYSKNGNMVHAKLVVDVTPTAAGSVVLTFSLPITAGLNSGLRAGFGYAQFSAGTMIPAFVELNSSTTAQVFFNATSTSSQTIVVTYDYALN